MDPVDFVGGGLFRLSRSQIQLRPTDNLVVDRVQVNVPNQDTRVQPAVVDRVQVNVPNQDTRVQLAVVDRVADLVPIQVAWADQVDFSCEVWILAL